MVSGGGGPGRELPAEEPDLSDGVHCGRVRRLRRGTSRGRDRELHHQYDRLTSGFRLKS